MSHDVSLYSRLYIASQAREVDMDNLFAHKNHKCPPALSFNGRMHSAKKSELIKKFKTIVAFHETAPVVDAKIIDGAALVHSLDPKKGPSSCHFISRLC